MPGSFFQGELKPGDVKRFKRDGHLIIRRAYDPEMLLALSDKLEAARGESALEKDPEARKDPNAFFWRRSPEIAKFVLDAGLGEAVTDLLGIDGTRLIHESLFEKKKGSSHVKWHRDSFFWSFAGRGAVTVWIPLQDTPLSMSPLRYASGSHLAKNTHVLKPYERFMVPFRYPIAVSPLKLGDIVIHHYETLHGAARSKETATRKALSLHLFDADARVVHSQEKGPLEHAVRCRWDRLEAGAPFPENIAPTVFRRAAISDNEGQDRARIVEFA